MSGAVLPLTAHFVMAYEWTNTDYLHILMQVYVCL
jgi:hypothetical protein